MEFESALRFVLSQEGTYSNDPYDRGGETKYGISSNFIKANAIELSNIRDLTLSQAKEIYLTFFWNPLKINGFIDSIVQLYLFDTAVNCGNARAIEFLQSSINTLSHIAVDGIIGNETTRTCNDLCIPSTTNKILKSLLEASERNLWRTCK